MVKLMMMEGTDLSDDGEGGFLCIKDMKEKLCYVAEDLEAEQKKFEAERKDSKEGVGGSVCLSVCLYSFPPSLLAFGVFPFDGTGEVVCSLSITSSLSVLYPSSFSIVFLYWVHF